MFQKPRKINGSSNVVLASDVFRMNLFLERQHPFNDKKSIKEKSNDMLVNESFHESVAKVFLFAQFFALMPLENVTSKTPANVKFKWKSFRAIFTVFYICYACFTSIVFYKVIFGVGVNAKNIVGCVFFTYCTSCGLVFLFLAQKWPNTIKIWYEKEQSLLRDPYKIQGWKLSTKIRIAATSVITLACIEHTLFVTNSVYNQYREAKKCKWTINDPFEHFFVKQFAFLFGTFKYNLPFGFFVELINISFTFGWNYMDLFVCMISIGITTRFNQINKRIEGLKGKVTPESTWIEIREHYVLICELLEIVDKNLEFVILLSNMNNLYFICFQLLNVYDKLPFLINYIYFWFSLIYLLSRTLCTQFLASSIHESSNIPLSYILTIPTEGWCVEVERFLEQVRTQKIALSGMKFFQLTRKMILGMLSVIVTYELVLLQFDVNTKDVAVVVDPCLSDHY